MIVCHCKRVTDREVKAAIQDGARCADSVGRACGAGTGCGGCRSSIDELIEHEDEPSLALLTTAALVGTGWR